MTTDTPAPVPAPAPADQPDAPPEWQQRAITELAELQARVDSLSLWLAENPVGSPAFESHAPLLHRKLLTQQLSAMVAYCDILAQRVKLFPLLGGGEAKE